MGRFKESEDFQERYNYKQMNKEELYRLVKTLLTDKDVLAHFYLYKVAREVLGDN